MNKKIGGNEISLNIRISSAKMKSSDDVVSALFKNFGMDYA